MNNELRALIRELSARQVRMCLDGGRLKTNSPPGAIDEGIAEQIRRHREPLIQLLESASLDKMPSLLPLERRPGEHLPLSSGQRRLWFLNELAGGSAEYNITVALRMRGNLDQPSLQAAIDGLIERHEILRTTFGIDDGEPYQVANPSRPLVFPQLNRSDVEALARDETLMSVATEESTQVFNLSTDLMIRAVLVVFAPDDHGLVLTVHHIAADGWSVAVLSKELIARYSKIRSGRRDSVSESLLQYVDYASWQSQCIGGGAMDGHLAYWSSHLENAPQVHSLPTIGPRPPRMCSGGRSCVVWLDEDLVGALRSLGISADATLFMVLKAAFGLLISRWSETDDVVIGTPVAGRNHARLSDLIGFFVNVLPIRSTISGNPAFTEFLEQTRQTILAALDHQDVPFEQIVERIQPSRNMSHTPLFQVLFVLQNNERINLAGHSLDVSAVALPPTGARYDLELSIAESDGKLRLEWIYATTIFEPSQMQRLADSYIALLTSISQRPETGIRELSLSSASAVAELDRINETFLDYPRDHTVHCEFENQAAAWPERICLICGDSSITYQDLNSRANRLAWHLKNQGVEPGTLVAICADRSISLIVGLLGILKAGAGYVPLDPAYPLARLHFMLRDSGVKHLLAESGTATFLDAESLRVTLLDDDRILSAEDYNPAIAQSGETPAYMMYTSGSTGIPKGVVVCHRNVVNLFVAIDQALKVDAEREGRLLAVTSISFDMSVSEIFWTLSRARCVVLAQDRPGAVTAHNLAVSLCASVSSKSDTPAPNWASIASNAGLSGVWQWDLSGVSEPGQQTKFGSDGKRLDTAEWIGPDESVEAFGKAGRRGVSVSTSLLGQSLESLARKIKTFREAQDSSSSCATIVVHVPALMGRQDDVDNVGREARHTAFKQYLRENSSLLKHVAEQMGVAIDNEITLDAAFERFVKISGFFRTADEGLGLIAQLRRIGVNEIACIVDFGLTGEILSDNLDQVARLAHLIRAARDQQVHLGCRLERAETSAEAIRTHAVGTLQCTPSYLTELLLDADAAEALAGLSAIYLGGEPISEELVHRIRRYSDARIFNVYGPTETTIFSAVREIIQVDIRIGGPLANTQFHVLDQHGQVVPVGIAGELHISGDGVSGGYWQRPDESAKAFLPNPFGTGRLYRTGDRVRANADGAFEYLGRIGNQAKIRGFRVELGEIELAIRAEPTVHDALVMLSSRQAEPIIIAYVVPSIRSVDIGVALRAALRAKLPEFMVPSKFVTMSALPKTPNGKIDLQALPSMSHRKDDSVRYMEPRTATERALLAVWESTTDIGIIGVDDNFFDMGASSLLLVKLQWAINARFGCGLKLEDVVRTPTIEAIAQIVDNDLSTRAQAVADESQSAGVDCQPKTENAASLPWEHDNILAYSPIRRFRNRAYLIHGSGCFGANFDHLATAFAGADVDVYAIAADGLPNGRHAKSSILEMAAAYSDQLSTHREGQIWLAGYCMGGLIAHEMNQILQRRHMDVGGVMIIGRAPPYREDHSLYDSWYEAQFFATLCQRLSKNAGVATAEVFSFLSTERKIERASQLLGDSAADQATWAEVISAHWQMEKAHLDAQDGYFAIQPSRTQLESQIEPGASISSPLRVVHTPNMMQHGDKIRQAWRAFGYGDVSVEFVEGRQQNMLHVSATAIASKFISLMGVETLQEKSHVERLSRLP